MNPSLHFATMPRLPRYPFRLNPQERLVLGLLQRATATRRGRQILFALVLCVVLLFAGFWLWDHFREKRLVGSPAGPIVRIATWNLHKSGRSRFDYATAAAIIRDGAFDIVALQEVTRETASATARGGGNLERLVASLGPAWRITSVSPVTGNSEAFDYLYNAEHAQLVSEPHPVASVDTIVFDRWPYQASFRAGQFDFTLITVHLFYGKGTAADHAKRRREMEALARIASKLAAASDEKDIIVLGDFNEERLHGNINLFEAKDWRRLVTEPTNLSSTEIFDNVLIDPKFTREWATRSGVVRFDEARYIGNHLLASEQVSDHRPAWADFRTDLPDDD